MIYDGCLNVKSPEIPPYVLIESTIDTNINLCLCKLIGKVRHYVLSMIWWCTMVGWFACDELLVYDNSDDESPASDDNFDVLLIISNGLLICVAMDCWFTLPVSTRRHFHTIKMLCGPIHIQMKWKSTQINDNTFEYGHASQEFFRMMKWRVQRSLPCTNWVNNRHKHQLV